MLSDKMYNFLKWFALIAMPATASFVGIVGEALNYAHTATACTIISAFGLFIGALIGVSCANYGGKE